MKEYLKTQNQLYKELCSSENGLNSVQVDKSRSLYGKNEISKIKQKPLIKRIFDALFEPMLIILEISMFITLGVNLGKYIKCGDGDFYECIGILISIAISVFLTLYMEGRSRKSFEMLNKIYDKVSVKVIRNGEAVLIPQTELVVGDIVSVSVGDKIFADGRIITSSSLAVDESTLTGESLSVKKNANIISKEETPIAERFNMLYSGTFVTAGNGLYIVTAVGNNAEIGKIAKDIQISDSISAPLQEKLQRLSKTVTALGIISAVFVLILNVIRLYTSGNVNFSTVQDAFLNAIVLIVASVPEGLPTTVAISLTLNVLKLSKSNALIKKLVAAETVGCVSVICSDKTGTLTENKMKVFELLPFSKQEKEQIFINSAVNSTADIVKLGGDITETGSATEIALLKHLKKSRISYQKLREKHAVLESIPFDSNTKFSAVKIKGETEFIYYVKGAPEVIIENSILETAQKQAELNKINAFQQDGKRVIAFATLNAQNFKLKNLKYSGFAVISDPIRKDVYDSVTACKMAGISVKILTGDNADTAYSIAKDLQIASSKKEVFSAYQLDGLSDAKLKELLPNIKVVARSTPKTKLRIVTLLKEMGEVVAVTGDGVNDAPAIKHADIGISMGSGSEISKEASDVVLLDDSFSTIVTAISFGRNIYQNFQRFTLFQLSVNFSAVLFIVTSLLLGFNSPFTSIQILWINLIMDGPPALTLGLETRGFELMNQKPVKRSDNIMNKSMFVKVFIHAVLVCAVLTLQYRYDFIGCGSNMMNTVIFTLFILFQLFNAFNARELGSVSIIKNLKSNKPMLIVFGITFVLHVIFTQFFGWFFSTVSLPINVWFKMVVTAFSVILISEIAKFVKRIINKSDFFNYQREKSLIKKKNNA